MQLIITDVTEMSAGNFCVAGWHIQAGRMVRPLPNGSNWTAALLQKYHVTPGVVLNFVPLAGQHPGAFPHRTEDTPVDVARIGFVTANAGPWFGAAAPPCAPTVADAFQGHVTRNSISNGVSQGVHVPINTQTRSLWAVRCAPGNLTFVADFGKLKGELHDGAATYRLAVSSQTLKTAYRAGGLAAVNNAIPQNAPLHVRLGLARAFGNVPDKCYLMINGVYW